VNPEAAAAGVVHRDVEALRRFVDRHRRLAVVTGAGCSVPSGIGDYRDHNGDWKRARPIQHQDFVASRHARQRYWARSMHGWPAFAAAEPNAAHRALARLEGEGRLTGLITQNVDGLHQRAGSRRVIDLHGRLAQVICLDCDAQSERSEWQRWLERHNAFLGDRLARPAPDGDADLQLGEAVAQVAVPDCPRCGGLLKPDVVFYGDSVPRDRVAQALAWVDDADALLIVGSSLMVYSSFRFARRARERGIPMAAVNLGRTRADAWLTLRVAQDCAEALEALCS